MKKVMLVFGTRPEAIKMCPVVQELRIRETFQVKVCVTGQHREMLDQVLDCFKIRPDYDLSVMKHRQTLYQITAEILLNLQPILENERPDIVLVHGDTTTTFATSLACFYHKIPVAHVEAGLRTHNLYSPFPEEFNRQAVGVISALNFCPTELAKRNLLREGKREDRIFVTGNTVIDALRTTVRKDYHHPIIDWAAGSRLILLTAHRRENLGQPLRNIFAAIRKLVEEHPDVKVVYPIHMNPQIRQIAEEELPKNDRIRIVEPLDVVDFHNLMAHSYLILSDSGGIQEEAPSLNVPVLVMRDTTERPEGIAAGTLKLVGTDEHRIYESARRLLEDELAYRKMSTAENPYGDGHAASRIVSLLETYEYHMAYANHKEIDEVFMIQKDTPAYPFHMDH